MVEVTEECSPFSAVLSFYTKAIPLFFFRLASNAFSDIGSAGRIEKKNLKKKITRSLGIEGPGNPGQH